MSILNYIEKIKRENEGPRITAQEPRNMADGGIIGKPGGLVEPGVEYYGTSKIKKGKFKHPHKFFNTGTGKMDVVYKDEPIDYSKRAKRVSTKVDLYKNALDEFNLNIQESFRTNNASNLQKSWAQFLKDKGLTDSTYHSLVKANSLPKVKTDVAKLRLDLANKIIDTSNNQLRFTEMEKLLKNHGFTSKNYKQLYGLKSGKLNYLDKAKDKAKKAYDFVFSNFDQPVENLFNPRQKIADLTGLTGETLSRKLNFKEYDPENYRLFRNLGNPQVQGKIAKEGLSLGEFDWHLQNRVLVYEEAGKELRNLGSIEGRIMQDAWRHTSQGGKQIEWIKKPGIDELGNIIRWGDAEFRYVGPNSSGRSFTLSNLNTYAAGSPEFKNYFKAYGELDKLRGQKVMHPVKKIMVPFEELMKEVYHFGAGKNFRMSPYQVDHLNLIEDVFGNSKKYGLRVIPRRINEAAGVVKSHSKRVEKGLGTEATRKKYGNPEDIYNKIGYDFNKTQQQLIDDEVEFAGRVFNKFQGAGWRWDGKNWKPKPGMEKSAYEVYVPDSAKKANPELKKIKINKIIQSPIDIAESIRLEKFKVPPRGATELLSFPANLKNLKNVRGKGTLIGGAIELAFYKLDVMNEMSKGKNEAEAKAQALSNSTLGLYKNKEYMKDLKKVAEEKGWDTRAFDKAFTLNDTIQKVNNQKEIYKQKIKSIKEMKGDPEKKAKTLDGMKKASDAFDKSSQKWIEKQVEGVAGQVSISKAAETFPTPNLDQIKDARYQISDLDFEMPFVGLREAAYQKLLKEKKAAFDVQSKQVDPEAGPIGDVLQNYAFNLPAWHPKHLLLQEEAPHLKEKRHIKEMSDFDPKELYRYNIARGVDPDYPITAQSWENLKSKYPGLGLAGGGRAGYMGGGITGIRRPSALPPTGGPMHQGLRSLYINDKDY